MNAAFTPLEQVTRPTVDTAAAAYYLNRKPQTLREWAMTGKVIKPIRINGRLAWPVAEIKRILGATA
jgi:predicted site-specific integrase-resolvase